jgi:hypothetical protein
MRIYLQDLINRLSQFSEKLDNTALFIDKPWVLIDIESNYHKYIFKRDGQLVMSLNGQVQLGNWEYLQGAKSILIDRIKDKILLNQSFFDNAVMILKVDGTNNELFILANETLIPDLDVKKYLQSVTYKKFNVVTGMLENGKTLEIYRGTSEIFLKLGMKATIDGERPDDGKYKSQNTGRYYELKNGKLFKITYPKEYQTIDGLTIVIEHVYEKSISVGDLVYIEKQLANTGKYKLGSFTSINIVDGVITKKSIF